MSNESKFLAKISPTLWQAMLVALLFAAIFFVGVPSVSTFAKNQADAWLAPELALLGEKRETTSAPDEPGDKAAQELNEPPSVNDPLATSNLPDVIAKRLDVQAAEARRGALTHLKIAVFFSVRYYAALTVAAYLALLAAICFAFISRDGWAQSSPYLVTSFIVLSMCTTYFAALPSLYQLQQNVDSNKRLYAEFKKILSDIHTYAVAWPTESKLPSNEAFVLAIDKELAALRSLPLTFNTGALKDLQKSLQEIVVDPSSASGQPGSGDKGRKDANAAQVTKQ